MKVWLLHHESYGEVSVFSENTDMLEVPSVKRELDYLVEAEYDEEHGDFVNDYESAKRRGNGEATIEERIRLELVRVYNG